MRWTAVEEVHEGGAALLPEIERRLDELDAAIREATDKAVRAELQAEQTKVLDLRDDKRAEDPVVTYHLTEAGRYGSDWAAAADDIERRQILGDAIARIVVKRGRPGRRTPEQVLARLDIQWREDRAGG